MRALALALVASILLFAQSLGGTYRGSYSGTSGASGDFVISLTKAVNGEWSSEVTFTLGGQEVKTRITSLKVDGSKLAVVYQFDLQGTALESSVTGELAGSTLAGDYHTKVVADGSAVDEGTWKATAGQ